MAYSVKLCRRRTEVFEVSDRVAVVRTFFDGATQPKYSDYLPPQMKRIVGTIVNVHSESRIKVKWDIDDSLSFVRNSDLEKVVDDCDEQGTAFQAAESHALLEELDEDEIQRNGKKKKTTIGKKFRKNLEELGRDESVESDGSDVEFEVNSKDKVRKKVVKEKEIGELVVKKVRESLGKKRKIDGEIKKSKTKKSEEES